MKKVTLLIPVYNEEAMLPTLYQRLIELINRNSAYEWEILFINDGSSDRTLEVIRRLRQTDSRVNFVNLSRNFGKEIAMLAGFDYATGDCCVVMDADLQDPPELVDQMLQYWKKVTTTFTPSVAIAAKKVGCAVGYRLLFISSFKT